MKILVTGAHGFLGRNTARHLSHLGHVVSGLGHGTWSDSELSDWGLSVWHSSHVTLDELVTYAGEPELIVHCAGSGSVGYSVTHPYQDYLRTVGSTAAVLEYIRLHSPHTTLVYPSSAAVYGQADRLPIVETDIARPVSPYGVHKLMAEHLCQSYASTHRIAVAVLRFFSIFGEGLRKQLLWDACIKAAAGEHRFSGSGLELRDWLHVADAASLIAKAAAYAAPSCPIVNGASGVGVTVRDILCRVFEQFPHSAELDFSGELRPGDPLGYLARIDRARQFGWSPSIGWLEGVHRYVSWFKTQSK